MPDPSAARRTSNIYFIAATVLGVLWTAARFIPDDAADGWLIVRGLVQGPLFALMIVCMCSAVRRRGWADGFEAALSRKESDHDQPLGR